jgi:D-sedoheptulose 7-phosphate isomerase
MIWFDRLVQNYPDLEPCQADVVRAYETLAACFRAGGKLLICGNGGSAADCEHIVGELMKGFLRPRPTPASVSAALKAADPATGDYLTDHLQGALPAISLVSQTSLMTAFANDVAPDMVFAQQVYGYGRAGDDSPARWRAGDVVLGISTSGNSRNVLHAVRVGRALGLTAIGLTGQSGGQLPGLCDVTIRVPYTTVTEIQERHLAVYHALCAQLEEDFFP